jgi:hypothetical protein
MTLGLNDFDAQNNPLLGPWEGVGPENLNFLGLNDTRFAHCHFRAQKSIDFQGPPLPITYEMYFPASNSLRPAPQTAGTL